VYRTLLLAWSLVFFCVDLTAQTPVRDTLDLANFRMSKRLRNYALYYKDSTGKFQDDKLFAIPFRDTLTPNQRALPLVGKTLYLKCYVRNSGDTSLTLFFNPGFYFKEISVFERDTVSGITRRLPDYAGLEKKGFKRIMLEPGELKQLYFKLKLNKSDVNSIDPTFVYSYFLPLYQTASQNRLGNSQVVTFVISGILLMMIFYALAVFVLNRNRAFLYYAGYAFFWGLMFFLLAYTYRTPSWFSYCFEGYIDFMLMCVGTFFYIAFLKQFIDSKRAFPAIHKLVSFEQATIIISVLWFTYEYFLTDNFKLQMAIENLTKLIWLIITVLFIIVAFRSGDRLLRFLAMGHSCLLLLGGTSFFIILFKPVWAQNLPDVFGTALFYIEIGITIELVFFLGALAFKNRNDIIEKTREGERLKILSERQGMEKQLAVFSAKQEERNRISADMHDELGSAVTAIRLMSEIVKHKMKDNALPEIDKISTSASDLIGNMNTLIWTMKSENDTLESLVAYLRTYAFDFFENTPIECHVKMPPLFRHVELTGERRRNIFLTIKETLNNILKHSKAKDVTISFEINDNFHISIADNGVGIEFDKLRQFGNGLKNMKKRIEGIGGNYTIRNNDGPGTITIIELFV
jgi:signal transduction histidine kinase